ncbi:MAG: leucine--tRNA ligase [Bacteroidales bacterium]|nr:leucine--tRNA ligase [Bacteroidales bacterium]
MDYNFTEIEKKWQEYWQTNKIYKTENQSDKPKYYILDMFPYPSGAGLHVGHPLGYIASDIYARYKRLKGYNVLHPMGYDSFGLPAEQYAIQTGKHPAITTKENISRYREQLDKLGFSFDWSREIITSDPQYYKWTQWTFIRLFHSWYNKKTDKAEKLDSLLSEFEKNGNTEINAADTQTKIFTKEEWKNFSNATKSDILMNYRLAYQSETLVNWCPELGTVLANDEVKEGYSIRGNHPVERKKMKQWLLRVSAYAERLLNSLDKLDWPESLKEIQKNWIGKSKGAIVYFALKNRNDSLEIFTTRPDTLFGCTFMVLAPEHKLALEIASAEHKAAIIQYIEESKKRSERERQAETRISGVFTGAYCIHPFTGEDIPVWIADYVLAGYGTGAIMSVPAHDSRDYAFAKHYKIKIKKVVSGGDITEQSYDAKEGTLINSDFLNGLNVPTAIETMNKRLESDNLGYGTINYRLRDAIFSRQRYWGEPFPIYYKESIPYTLSEKDLPLELPEIDSFLPTTNGEAPLARAKNWITGDGYQLETDTMPGFAGSSGYYLRYMDPYNKDNYFSPQANNYWENVDLYIGGAEHATGHLIYSRFWNKFLFDMNLCCKDEPFKKIINQGMIQGRSSIIYRLKGKNKFVSFNLKKDYEVIAFNVDISLVNNDILDIEAFRKWRQEYAEAEFILENGKYICGVEIEKMSKSKFNVVNPDDLVEKYGADTLRMYEMFLGPIEQHKPWDTNGIEGVFRFIRKFWRLYHNQQNEFSLSDEKATAAELKLLHRTIKRIEDDILRFSFNTSVSNFMICVNELNELKCNKREILEPLIILISPFAPHLAEELWSAAGNHQSVLYSQFPACNEDYLKENSFSYPVSFNGKMRFNLELQLDLSIQDIEKIVLANELSAKWLEGKSPKKVIIVPKKIINIVV